MEGLPRWTGFPSRPSDGDNVEARRLGGGGSDVDGGDSEEVVC